MEILEAYDATDTAHSAAALAGVDPKAVPPYAAAWDAGRPVRHPQIVEAGRHYGTQVHTCVPYDPESKGGSGSTVHIPKADLVPTDANLRGSYGSYGSFAELGPACAAHLRQGRRASPSGDGQGAGAGVDRGAAAAARAPGRPAHHRSVDGSIAKTINRITRGELVVADDIGMLPSGQAAAEDRPLHHAHVIHHRRHLPATHRGHRRTRGDPLELTTTAR